MLDIIANNPFRILGVWSNAKQADIVRNVSKMKAYLNVGKTIDFPTDMEGLLSSLNRSMQLAQTAQAAINLPNDKIRYALFWFCNADPIDSTGLSNLASGDSEKAKTIFTKKDSYSSLVNRAVLALIQSDYSAAISAYSTLIHDSTYLDLFCSSICGETFQISEDSLSHMLFDELLKEVKAKALLQLIVNDADKAYVTEAALKEPLSKIATEINKAKSVSGTDAEASLKAGRSLIRNTKANLAEVKSLVGATSIQYTSAADNLAKQILQCGINYFNNTDDDNDIETALDIQQYALSIAVGKLVKDRCKQNVDILLKRKEQSSLGEDIKYIADALKDFQSKTPSVANARSFLTSCSSHLQVLKNAMGADNEMYLKISTAVANNALGMIIEVVNNASTSNISSYKSLLDSAMSVVNYIDHHIDKTKQEEYRLLTNAQTLGKLQMNAILAEASQRNRQTTSSSSGGCYIATMVYGDYDHPQVMVLRDFRDSVLQKYAPGRAFIRFYYRYSPTWVEHLKDKKKINNVIRFILDKFIAIYKNEKN
jgi:hypothetical protein